MDSDVRGAPDQGLSTPSCVVQLVQTVHKLGIGLVMRPCAHLANCGYGQRSYTDVILFLTGSESQERMFDVFAAKALIVSTAAIRTTVELDRVLETSQKSTMQSST